MTVYDCIVAVSSDLAQAGISKSRKNEQQGYRFRGIDEVFNALAPLLAKYGLVILPRVLSRTVVEHASRSGGVLFYVTVDAEFDFVSAADGSKHTVKTYGEAMDSADKATNKAMSAAYKYAALQTFCIPTEGDNDADATTHELAQVQPPPPAAAPSPRPAFVPTSVAHATAGLRVVTTKIAKQGSNAKGPWTLYAVKFSDGREGTTFSQAIYDAARAAAVDDDRVEVTFQGKNIFTLKVVAPVAPPPEDHDRAEMDYQAEGA